MYDPYMYVRGPSQIWTDERDRMQCGAEYALGEAVDLELYVLIDAQQNHVVDSGTQDDDGESFVHAGPGHCLGGRGDLLGLAKQYTLGTGFAGVEGISLRGTESVSCAMYH
jgi:hypothetical protein